MNSEVRKSVKLHWKRSGIEMPRLTKEEEQKRLISMWDIENSLF